MGFSFSLLSLVSRRLSLNLQINDKNRFSHCSNIFFRVILFMKLSFKMDLDRLLSIIHYKGFFAIVEY